MAGGGLSGFRGRYQEHPQVAPRSVESAYGVPDTLSWRYFVKRLLIGLAATAVVVGVVQVPVAASAASAKTSWRFAPTVEAPWANYGSGHGKDVATAYAGLCRSAPFTGTGAYSPVPANGEVDAIIGDPVNSTGFSNLGCTSPQNETSIAVNPTNPNNLVAGANDYRVVSPATGLNDGTGWAYYSNDGGTTWGNVQLPGLTSQTGGTGSFKKFTSAGDPVLAFSPEGVVYYANILFNRNGNDTGIAVNVSRDGGQTWSRPNLVAYVDTGNFFLDKEWIAAGPNGKVVVTWTKFVSGAPGQGAPYLASPIVAGYSSDFGKTWNRQGSPVSDAAHPYNQGSQVSYAPDGSLLVAYEGAAPSTGYATDALVLARSTNNGKTFANMELARVFDDFDCYPVYNGRQTLTDMHFRLNSYPSMSVDPTTGTVSIVWTDNEGSGNCGSGAAEFVGTTAAQVKLVSGTWGQFSAARQITTGSADKVFPSVAANGGKVTVSYYTRSYALASSDPVLCNVKTPDGPTAGVIQTVPSARSVCMDYASLSSTDGFTSQTRLSSQSSNPFVQFADGAFIGDYTQVALGTDGIAHASWTDFRGNPGVTPANQDVYVRSYRP